MKIKKKKLTAKAVNMALSGTRFVFGTTADLTKATLDMSGDVAGFFTDVHLPNRVGDSLWHCGQSAVTKGMDHLQGAIRDWGGR